MANSVTWGFTRNPANQIKTETQSNDAFSWDAHVDVTRTYATNGLNQYTNVSGNAYCYDDNGNLTRDGQYAYLYDIENRLVEMRAMVSGACPAGSSGYTGQLKAQLRYDPAGRLYEVENFVGGVAQGPTRFLYDGDALVAEYNASGTMLARYIHGPAAGADDPIAAYTGSGVAATDRTNLYADARGSIVLNTKHDGTNAQINTYDAYGVPGSANTGRFQYTGQVWLAELGMYYYKARMYSPQLGRFMQTDPIGYEDNVNLYGYVANDPVNGVDPTGLAGCGSNIDGVNNCSGMSGAKFEATQAADRWAKKFNSLSSDDQATVITQGIEKYGADRTASAVGHAWAMADRNGGMFGESRADYFRRRYNISETPRPLLPSDLGPQSGGVVVLEGAIWERRDTLMITVTGLLAEPPSGVVRQGLGKAVQIARDIGLNRVDINAWVLNPKLRSLVDRGALTRAWPGTTINHAGGIMKISIPVP